MSGTHPFSFPKQERMSSRLQITSLFEGGKSHSLSVFPIRMVYTTKERQEGDSPVQLLVSVSKRYFKHAVDRNRVKRQIREVYRRHRQLFQTSLPEDRQLLIACIWLSARQEPTARIEDKLVLLMQRVAEKL